MSDIVQRIADAIRDEYAEVVFGETNGEAWRRIASAVVSELGLKPSYVTGWMGASGIVRVTPPRMGEEWPDEPAQRYVRWGTTKWELAE